MNQKFFSCVCLLVYGFAFIDGYLAWKLDADEGDYMFDLSVHTCAWLLGVTFGLTLLCMAVNIKLVGAEFQLPDLSVLIVCAIALMALLTAALQEVMKLAAVPSMIAFMVNMYLASLCLLCLRGWSWPVLVLATGEFWGSSWLGAYNVFGDGDRFYSCCCLWALLAYLLPAVACSKYRNDQIRIACLTPVMMFFFGGLFGWTSNNILVLIGACVEALVFLWVALLAKNIKRRFPAGLASARWVRLAYFEMINASCTQIRRMQELPDRAFGDAGKASILLITSHRWLDRYTCDVPAPGAPQGRRLSTMVARANLSFPHTLCSAAAGGFLHFIKGLCVTLCYQGCDVLLFFDFMSIPQVGKTDDGIVIERTEAETALFYEVLPQMGFLYTTFSVLVLPEISEGVHPYFTSGWCFCEFVGAMLARTLNKYSPDIARDYQDYLLEYKSEAQDLRMDVASIEKFMMSTVTLDLSNELMGHIENDISKKCFFDNADRDVVKGIVHGFLLKRLLRDAIRSANEDQFCKCISQLREAGLLETLSHPVDSKFDTLLHKATAARSSSIVKMLLQAGADATARNIYGDTPAQVLMVPRVSTAANLCRQAAASQQGGKDSRKVAPSKALK